MNRIPRLRILIALAIIALAGYWAFNTVTLREQSYSGANLSFDLGRGSTAIANRSGEPASARLTSTGARASFSITSSNPDLSVRSDRAGNGSNTINSVELELPVGTSDLRVARGSGVNLTIEGNGPFDAVVTRLSADEFRNTLIAAAVMVLGALYYISRTSGHRWMGWVRQRIPVGTAGV